MDHAVVRRSVIELSAPTLEDVPTITAACQDPEIAQWTTVPSPYGEDDAVAFVTTYAPAIWERGGACWVIRWEDELVGAIDLHDRDATSAEVGYWMAEPFRGRGILHDALDLTLDVAFRDLGLVRVRWAAAVGNWASWRVVWRHGFHLEGTRRAAYPDFRDPGAPWRDLWVGSLLRDDPRTPAAPWFGPEEHLPAIPNPRDPEALVRQFHETYNLPIAAGPANVDIERVHMRMALIAEEFAELMGAVYGEGAERGVLDAVARATADDDGTRDTVAAADALADLIYVVYGMALETGIPLDAVLRAVQRSNLSKLGEDGRPIYRADGKVLKGPGFFEPRIAEVLATTRLRPE